MSYQKNSQESAQLGHQSRVVVLSPTTSQPRFHRRAAMLVEAGCDVTVYAFRRGFYKENVYPFGVEVVDLGEVKDLVYFRRVPKLVRAVFKVRRQEQKVKRPNLIYAFGLDMALLGSMAMPSSIPLVYEVGDVPDPLPHTSVISKVLEKLEKVVLKKCSALSVTSRGFLKEYFSLIAPGIEHKTMVIENMISKEAANKFPRPQGPKAPVRPIKIGFVGLFRYKDSIVALMEAVARRTGDFELHFYGDGHMKNVIDDYVSKYDNIFNHGPFISTDDMKRIYDSIDISYVVYDNRRPNVRMALPNKLYEAPYFGVPIAVAGNTYLSQRVREMNSGFIMDPQEEGFIDKWLDGLTPEVIGQMSEKLLQLDDKQMVESYGEIVPKLIELGQINSN